MSESISRDRWDALPDAVLVADAAFRYVDANLAATRLFGYTLAELRAMTTTDLVAHGAEWTVAERKRFLAAGSWRGSLVVRSKSQALLIVEARVNILRLPDRTEYLTVYRESSTPVVGLAVPASPPGMRLTPREREVIALVADGASSKQIAAQLAISARTADTHRDRIMRKLKVDSIAALTRFAIRHGLSRGG